MRIDRVKSGRTEKYLALGPFTRPVCPDFEPNIIPFGSPTQSISTYSQYVQLPLEQFCLRKSPTKFRAFPYLCGVSSSALSTKPNRPPSSVDTCGYDCTVSMHTLRTSIYVFCGLLHRVFPRNRPCVLHLLPKQRLP